MTSRIAIGSLNPDSASSRRATRRLRLEPRSTENIAALSVEATIEPSRSAGSTERSSRRAAASPTMTAVATVPVVASETAGARTGRISDHPAARPPSNRISASATTPTVRVSSKSSKSISPSPSEPIAIPRPRKSTSPGTRSRPAASAARIPSASSAPVTSIIALASTRAAESMVGRARGGFAAPRPLPDGCLSRPPAPERPDWNALGASSGSLGPDRRSSRWAIHSAPAWSLTPWTPIGTYTGSAIEEAALTPPPARGGRAARRVIVATPLGPNHEETRAWPCRCACGERGEHRRRPRDEQEHGHDRHAGEVVGEQRGQGEERAEDDEDPELHHPPRHGRESATP